MKKIAAAFLILTVAGTGIASAAGEPGLASRVYGPGVHKGESELVGLYTHLLGGHDDGEWALVGEFEHGISDWWKGIVAFEIEHPYNGDTDFAAFAIESIFDFKGTEHWPVHLGALVGYDVTDMGPDVFELGLLTEAGGGPVRLRTNFLGHHEVGSGSHDYWSFGYATELRFEVNHTGIGIEGFGNAGTSDEFGDLGDQAHYWGPFVDFEVFHGDHSAVHAQFSYLAGVGESHADGQFRFQILGHF